MSYHTPVFSHASARHPIVLRFAEMRLEDLAKFVMHAERAGGDLSHVDPLRQNKNEHLIGDRDWVDLAKKEIEYMRVANFHEELLALKKRKRRKDMEARILEGLKDPWRASKGGPLREVILTANKDWFAEAEESDVLFSEDEKRAKEEQFKAHAVKWLKARFEADVIHAHADHDEMACHVHAVIMPRHEKKSARRGTQQTLQPSSHPLLESYEDAQDDVGAFFEEIGLRRGAKGAEARREAMRANAKARLIAGETGAEPVLQDIPKRREHVPTPVWWQTEILRLQNEAEALVRDQAAASRSKTEANQKIEKAKSAERAAKQRESAALEREKDAASVLAVADAVSSGELQFEGADHDVKQVLTEPQTSEEAITQETLKARSPRAVRLLQSLQNSFAQMRVKSDKLAEEKLATEAKAVRASAKAIESLKDAILKVVPQAARKRVLAEFLRVGQSAKKVEEKLRKSHGGRDE